MTLWTHRTLHSMTTEFIFSLVHSIFAKTDKVRVHKASLKEKNTSQKTEIIPSTV